jgi:hypothetical protein
MSVVRETVAAMAGGMNHLDPERGRVATPASLADTFGDAPAPVRGEGEEE